MPPQTAVAFLHDHSCTTEMEGSVPMRRVSVLVAVLLLLAATVGAPIAQARSAAANSHAAGRYIVTFSDEPVVTYTGYKAGFPATRPQAGKKLNAKSPNVVKWQKHLTAQHDAALAKVGATKFYDYTVTNNAVAVKLTAKQASKLAGMKGVISLSKDRLAHPDTSLSPSFLGLDGPGGLWSQLGGNRRAGAGVVVGVIDTGIWPESKSFAGGTGIPIPAGWAGKCVAGERFPVTSCNDKLIGARYFVAGFGKHNINKSEFLSPRDGDGHGSHTASTAAGNRVTGVSIEGKVFDDGTVSGMAPGAKVAAYKVCWTGEPGVADGCFNSDSVAAINAAVLDGVDVLNYSIGGSTESDALDAVAQAFRAASNAGVFVANSAGNSGPGASTLDHPAPWVTTVAAATHRRAFQAVELGNGARYVGASTTASITTATPFATSLSVKLASATDANAKLCALGTLDPAKVAGKIIQCDRGVVDRIEKSAEVKRAGGAGMVMTNTSANSLNGDFHLVPSVHVSHVDRPAILAYITAAGAGATAKIVPLNAAELAAAPQVPEVAAFSSRGPSTTTDGDILKPDIAAPGVDVLAAVAPPFHFGRSWDLISGTSMASPHIAGIGALMKAAHPTVAALGDQVGAHDDDPRHGRPDEHPVRPGRRVREPDACRGSGPRLPDHPERVSRVHGRPRRAVRTAVRHPGADHRLEPQSGVHRRRQARRHRDRHPPREERRWRGGDVHGECLGARIRRRRDAELVHPGRRRRADLHREVHAR